MTVLAPRPYASLTAAVMPRSLKEPVGSALELNEQLEPATHLFRQPPGRDERRIALQQRHRAWYAPAGRTALDNALKRPDKIP